MIVPKSFRSVGSVANLVYNLIERIVAFANEISLFLVLVVERARLKHRDGQK